LLKEIRLGSNCQIVSILKTSTDQIKFSAQFM
jgi:hypothetical protein